MKCKQLKKIEQYHHDGLKDDEFEFIKNHLEECRECTSFLARLKSSEQVLSKVKAYKPVLENPMAFKHEILSQIPSENKRSVFDEIAKLIDTIVYVLVQPVTRYSFVTAAVIIFGVFIYQQTILVQKIGSLEKRMESNVPSGESKNSNRKNIEAFFKKRSGIKADDSEFNELLDDYRLLLIKHKALLKTLKNNYPETYKDITKQLEEAELLPDNINI